MMPLKLAFKERAGPGHASLTTAICDTTKTRLHPALDFMAMLWLLQIKIMNQKDKYPFFAFSDLGMS